MCVCGVLRLMTEYEGTRATEGELTEQDMPSELLADVEANQTEDDRSAAQYSCAMTHSSKLPFSLMMMKP